MYANESRDLSLDGENTCSGSLGQPASYHMLKLVLLINPVPCYGLGSIVWRHPPPGDGATQPLYPMDKRATLRAIFFPSGVLLFFSHRKGES